MTFVPENWTLRALIDLPEPVPPHELLSLIGARSIPKDLPGARRTERELNARIYLYELVLRKDVSAVPPEVLDELQLSQFRTSALLVHVQLALGLGESASSTLLELLHDDLAILSDDVKAFLSDDAIQLLLDSSSAAAKALTEEAFAALPISEGSKRILQLAQTIASLASESPPAVISPLRDLTNEQDHAGVAAYYLTARVYGKLRLPLEERQYLHTWLVGMAKLYGRSPADLAGSVSRKNAPMEAAILDGVCRLILLLRASGSEAEINRYVSEFEKAGYGERFTPLRVNRPREEGCQCIRARREDTSEPEQLHRLLADILTNSPRQTACIVCPEDVTAEIEKFQISDFAAREQLVLKRITDEVSHVGMMTLPSVLVEGLMDSRRWIVCHDLSNPMDGLAIGVIPLQGEVSVVYARAVIFDTVLDQTKDGNWFTATGRLLARPFDAQKERAIRDAMRRVAEQLSAGETSLTITPL